jgi:hypothetical protein
VRLCHLGGKFHDVLQLTRLLTFFDVYDSEAAAVNSFHPVAARGTWPAKVSGKSCLTGQLLLRRFHLSWWAPTLSLDEQDCCKCRPQNGAICPLLVWIANR